QVPADLVLTCDSEVPATISLTATDTCAGEITAEGVDSIVAGDCPNSFVITRTWTFIDECGNETPISQTITVDDTIAPTFVEELPSDLTVECNEIPVATILTATDNCGAVNIIYKEIPFVESCNYTIIRVWTAVD